MGGNSHKLERARLLQGVGELVALQVTSNVPQFFLYLKKTLSEFSTTTPLIYLGNQNTGS